MYKTNPTAYGPSTQPRVYSHKSTSGPMGALGLHITPPDMAPPTISSHLIWTQHGPGRPSRTTYPTIHNRALPSLSGTIPTPTHPRPAWGHPTRSGDLQAGSESLSAKSDYMGSTRLQGSNSSPSTFSLVAGYRWPPQPSCVHQHSLSRYLSNAPAYTCDGEHQRLVYIPN